MPKRPRAKRAQKPLPGNPREWEIELKLLPALSRNTIHDLESFQSGSGIKDEQFILLRAVWTANDISYLGREAERQQWMTEKHYQEARKLLKAKFWTTYLESLSHSLDEPLQPRGMKFPELGTFTMVQYYQCQIKEDPDGIRQSSSPKIRRMTRSQTAKQRIPPSTPKTPTRKGTQPPSSSIALPMASLDLEDDDEFDKEDVPSPDTPDEQAPDTVLEFVSPEANSTPFSRTEDEQIVNTALVCLLDALTIHLITSARWTLHRRAFRLTTTKGGYEARVDGYLRDGDDRVLAILEVKPRDRKQDKASIQRQEAAQMAAWIAEIPPKSNGKEHIRLLVSQDHQEIFITFAKFSDNYVQYLRDPTKPQHQNPSFLTMNEYGPFNIRVRDHI